MERSGSLISENEFLEDIIAREVFIRYCAEKTIDMGGANNTAVGKVYLTVRESPFSGKPLSREKIAATIADNEINCSNMKYLHNIHDEVIRQKYRKMVKIFNGLKRLGDS